MEEIKPQDNTEEKQQKPLLERLKELEGATEDDKKSKGKHRKIKIPRKAKVKGRKLKKGFIGVLKISENGVITGEKQRLSESTIKDSSDIYHGTDGTSTLFWEGKYPVIIQPTWKNSPLKIHPQEEKNETYIQPYIKARMLADTIKVKSKGKQGIIIWVLIAGAALFGLNYLSGGTLFG